MPKPGSRNGDLDDALWSAARISTVNNFGQGQYNSWGSSTVTGCGSDKANILPPNDMFFCAGGSTPSMHFNDGYNDYGGFTVHSYRIRKPFDFAGRTGIVSFDVGAKAQMPGGHGWWFNIFIADEPVGAPYQQGGAIALFARAGVGFEFESASCSIDGSSNAFSFFYTEKDYKITKHVGPPQECFKTADEVLNHVELHISQSKLEVFVADAGKPETLRSVAKLEDANLELTRGYVNLQHSHYNAAKGSELTPHTTYHWDNVGFDGPVLPGGRGYDVPDNATPTKGPDEGLKQQFPGPYINTGYKLGQKGLIRGSGGPESVTIEGVSLTGAKRAFMTYNTWLYCEQETIGFRFNGGTWRQFKHPFPTCEQGARAVLMPVDLADLKDGANTFEMTSTSGNVLMANGELQLED